MNFKQPVCHLFVVVCLFGIDARAQSFNQDHSCTVDASGLFVLPFDKDGKNFKRNAGFHVGGGFAVTPHGQKTSLFLTVDYLYTRLKATPAALQVITGNPNDQLSAATSAHGAFSALTFDPTLRHAINNRVGIYVSGGFGWLRRGVAFADANPSTLIQSTGSTLENRSLNSGVVDLGGGVNFGLASEGGVMLFADVHVFKGLTVNGATVLLPVSVGVRW